VLDGRRPANRRQVNETYEITSTLEFREVQLGRVVGAATSVCKHPSLQGWRLLVVQPLAADGASADGEPVLAVDRLGAARGQQVVITSDGRGTRELLGSTTTPVRWSVMGIRDG
jgi:ethanolamine utilization protein EutN